jgi:hypothetical protein
MLRQRLAIREKTEPDMWSTFKTRSQLGGALLERFTLLCARETRVLIFDSAVPRRECGYEQS